MKPEQAPIHLLPVSEGYKLIDDAWKKHGRLTYIHDEDATRVYVNALVRILRNAGWQMGSTAPRTFRHAATCCVIELEPGGSETNGHSLHYMKASESETSG
jgi:hypothetical protein